LTVDLSRPKTIPTGGGGGSVDSIQAIKVENQGKRFLLRSDLATATAAVFRAAGVAIPIGIQKIEIPPVPLFLLFSLLRVDGVVQ